VCGIVIVPKNESIYWHFSGQFACPLYNDGTGKTDDHGNGKYNNKKLIDACNQLLKSNTNEVNQCMLLEMKKLDIPLENLCVKLEHRQVNNKNIQPPAQIQNQAKPEKKSMCIIS
jgi:hypothetical protein